MTTNSDGVALKQKQVKKLAEDILKARTLMIVSIKGLPSKQFQEIKKSVREHANVKVAKKNIMLRALKAVGRESISGLEKYVTADCAFIISDMEGYELAGILAKKKTPVFAKAGQEAPDDIEVKAGPTDLVPGPAISELGALGIKIAVEEGKISIKADKVIVNNGGVISREVASLLQKLNIQPFNIGLEPSVVYDVETEKIYTDIKIDSEKAVEDLKLIAGKALGFAQKIVYYCRETVGYFLGRAGAEGEKLGGLVPEDKTSELGNSESKNVSDSQISESEQSEQASSSGSVEVNNINKEEGKNE